MDRKDGVMSMQLGDDVQGWDDEPKFSPEEEQAWCRAKELARVKNAILERYETATAVESAARQHRQEVLREYIDAEQAAIKALAEVWTAKENREALTDAEAGDGWRALRRRMFPPLAKEDAECRTPRFFC
jgi:hypothetical protein